MKKIVTMFIVLFCSMSLVACSNMSKQDTGVLAGGVAGGLLGSTVGKGDGRLLAIAAGTLAGAFIGGSIGKSMDETDRLKMNNALENNAAGQPAYWRNAKTGASYEVVPTKNVKVGNNKYCREYRTIADIGGEKRQVYGKACRQPDGAWKVVS